MTMSKAGERALKILFVRNLYWPEDFGGNRYPFEVTSRLARRGHRVRVVTGKRVGVTKPAMNGLVEIVYFPVVRGHPLATHATNATAVIPSFVAELRGNPDVVLVSSYDVGLVSSALPRRAPLVFIYHSSFYSEAVERTRASGPLRPFYAPLRAYMRLVERRVLGNADRIVAVSEFSRAEIVDRLPGAAARIVVIPTGVDSVFFAPPGERERKAARAKLRLAHEQNVAIVVGRLAPVKRYDRAVDVVAGLRDRGIDTTLLIVGDGPERLALQRHADDKGVADRVHFLGYRSGTELRETLWASDVQLCTSEFENLSLALIEGMAAGVPVAALPTGGTV